MAIELRTYQTTMVLAIDDMLRRHRKVCAVAPTGAGKAVVIAYYAQRITELGRPMLVVTNRRVLVQQLADQCQRYKVPFGIIMGSEPRNDEALVQVASLQTLKTRKWKNLPAADWCVVDESHQHPNACDTLFELLPGAKCLGVTATPVGPSGKTLMGLYDGIVEPIKNSDLIKANWLLPTKVVAPSEPDVEGVWFDDQGAKHKGVSVLNNGEFSQEQLANVVESCTCFADVWKWYEPYTNMQTLAFVPRVKFAYGLCDQFRERGIKAEVIEGATTTNERRQVIRSFADTDARVLVAVDVLREGFDAPIAQCGIDLQPCHQFRAFWQKLGRVRRPHGDQKEAIWLDFAGNLWRHGIHPDEDPPWSEIVEDKTAQEVLAERAGRKCKKCGSDQIKNGRCLDCGADCTNAKKPWVCESCACSLSPSERLTDGKCPHCGAKGGKQVRRIRMANGQMRVVDADELKLRKKLHASLEQKVWDSCRYKAMYCRKSLGFARVLYEKQMHRWPDHLTLKCCPEPQSADWSRNVADVYEFMDRACRFHTPKQHDTSPPAAPEREGPNVQRPPLLET